MSRHLLIVVVYLFALNANSQDTLSTGFTYELSSEILDQGRELYVSLPTGYDTMTQRPPVIYLLDAESRFNVSQGIIRYAQYSAMVPPAIIVGLANKSREERNFDYVK